MRWEKDARSGRKIYGWSELRDWLLLPVFLLLGF